MTTEFQGPVFGQLALEIGEMRFERFWTGHANVQAQLFALTLSMAIAPRQGYSDEMLAVIEIDAQDVVKAAQAHADNCKQIAAAWRNQRRRVEKANDRLAHGPPGEHRGSRA